MKEIKEVKTNQVVDSGRREALRKLGEIGLYVAPVTTSLLLTKKVSAQSNCPNFPFCETNVNPGDLIKHCKENPQDPVCTGIPIGPNNGN